MKTFICLRAIIRRGDRLTDRRLSIGAETDPRIGVGPLGRTDRQQ